MSENLKIWDVLGKTDPKQTKGFQRAGGFKGTAIKPIYTEQKMTEMFGPCGTGWGFTEPSFQTVPASDGQIAVYCWLSLWYIHEGKQSQAVPGVGGDFVVVKQSSGLRTNDEAFKAAFTDAIGNAMKHIGMSADVHMGRFDDSKYVREVTEELASEAKSNVTPLPQKVPAVTSNAIALGREIKQCKSLLDLNTLKKQPEFLAFWKSAHDEDRHHITAIAEKHKADLETPILQAGE